MRSGTNPTEGFLLVPGGKVWYRSVGDGGVPLLVLHGGPGVPSDIYFDAFSVLARTRQVVFYDQLGCGRSDRPDDTGLWVIDRFVDELQAVISGLELNRPHLYGHSWGGMLALEYMLRGHAQLTSVILGNTPADVERLEREVRGLMDAVSVDMHPTLARHEAAGTTSSPEYQSLVAQYMHIHQLRTSVLPASWQQALAGVNMAVADTMLGRDWNVTGNLRSWSVMDRLGQVALPTLLLGGEHDEIVPAHLEDMHRRIRHSELRILTDCSHMPFLEGDASREAYIQEISRFIATVEREAPGSPNFDSRQRR